MQKSWMIFETGTYLAATKLGQIKRFERKEFTPWRTYKSKSVKYAKLKDDSEFYCYGYADSIG